MERMSFCLGKKTVGCYCSQYESHQNAVSDTNRFKFRAAPRVPVLKYGGCPSSAGGCQCLKLDRCFKILKILLLAHLCTILTQAGANCL